MLEEITTRAPSVCWRTAGHTGLEVRRSRHRLRHGSRLACPQAVGPAGSIEALDIDISHLDHLASVDVEVRQHGIVAEPIGDASFDLVQGCSGRGEGAR